MSRVAATVPAPVALFVYNRPEHTRATVEALARNPEAEETTLIVYSDAPKAVEAASAVEEVRRYIRQINGFRRVEVVERNGNYGLARSIAEGVSDVCTRFGRVIVLEDDLVTSPYFLRYMNDALDLYVDNESVMHVSGCSYPIEPIKAAGDTYFLRVPLCWGWATWQRAWRHYSRDLTLMKSFDRKRIKAFNFDNTYDYWSQMKANRDGTINTWFVFWYARLFLDGGLSLFPAVSLVRNIGHDGTGVHCDRTSVFDCELSQHRISVVQLPVIESREAFDAHKRYFRRHLHMTPLARAWQKVRRWAGPA